MSIPLPPLPAPYSALTNGTLCYTAEQLRAIQREAMRVALEAAAKEAGQWFTARHIAAAIRAPEIEP